MSVLTLLLRKRRPPMGFADKFVHSLKSSNLMDDAFHHDLDTIVVAALAGALAQCCAA